MSHKDPAAGTLPSSPPSLSDRGGGVVLLAQPWESAQTPRGATGVKSPRRGSSRRGGGGGGVPLGNRRERVWSTARERVAASQYSVVENQVRRAMDCGQDSALVCRLFAGKDYEWVGELRETGQMNPRRKSVTALDAHHVDLHHSSYWQLKEQWRPFVRWLEAQGLRWDLCFIVEDDGTPYRQPVEAKYADIRVSWPPYMDSDVGRVRGQLLQYWEDKCVLQLELKGGSLSAAQQQWKELVKGALNSGQAYCHVARLYHPRDFYMIHREQRESVHEDLIARHPARAAVSNAIIPEEAVHGKEAGGGGLWALQPHVEALVRWAAREHLSWYLVFDVEADPTDKRSITKAKMRKLRELYERHANTATGVLSLDEKEQFLLDAVDLMDTPVRYQLSSWCLFTVTDLAI